MDKIIKKWRSFLQGRNSYQVYCDMDGVLVDLVKGIELKIPSFTSSRKVAEEAYAVLESGIEWQKLQHDPELSDGAQIIFDILDNPDYNERVKFWSELPATKYMIDLWDYIRDEHPIILSAPWKIDGIVDSACEEGKRNWIINNNLNPKDVILTPDKEKHAAPNHILIDDMRRYIDPWRKTGGIAIEHITVIDTIKELDKWLQ